MLFCAAAKYKQLRITSTLFDERVPLTHKSRSYSFQKSVHNSFKPIDDLKIFLETSSNLAKEALSKMSSSGVSKYALMCIIFSTILFGGELFLDSSTAQAKSHTEPTVGTTYYVNANSGSDSNSGNSIANAFRTLNHAVSKTNPGDTVLVMNGTYIGSGNSTATLRINRAGTADNWITYKAYPGHSPLIQSNGAFQAIRIETNYIIIDGFRVRGIRDQVSYQEAENAFNVFKNGGGYNEYVHGSGITLSHFNIVRNNEVYNFGGGGIEVTRTDSVIVENNLVYDNSHYSPFGHSGISVIYPKYSNRPNDSIENSRYDIIIRGNISHSNYNYFPCGCDGYRRVTDGNGIIIDIANEYQGWTLIANNIVFNNGGSGIHAFKTRNVDIINNSAFQNGQHPELEGEIYARESENVNIINNVMYARRGQRLTSDQGGTNITYAHNVYYDETNSPNIQSGLGEGDMVANPQFVNPTTNANDINLRLTSNSPGIDTGSDAYLPMTDFDGVSRTAGATDRGAYENGLANEQRGTNNSPAASATISPNGQSTSDTPTFVWAKVDDATSYRVFGRNIATDQIMIDKTYQLSEISCIANQCSARAPSPFGFGNFYWIVLTSNDIGEGTWSERMDFSIISGGSSFNSSSPDPISPSGTIALDRLTFVWENVSSASTYRILTRERGTERIVLDRTYQLGEVTCNATTCRLTPTEVIGWGGFTWTVQAKDANGYGTWGGRLDFSMYTAVTAAGTAAEPISNDDAGTAETEVDATIQLYLPLVK